MSEEHRLLDESRQTESEIFFHRDAHGTIGNPLMDEAQDLKKYGNENEPFTLDYLLDQIGFSTYHIKRFIPPALIALSDGAMIMTYSLSSVMIQKQWNYSDDLNILIISFMFFGVVGGAYLSGPIADKFGRRSPMAISAVLILFTNAISAFSPGIVFYAIARGLLAFSAGFYSPIGFTYILEIIPPSVRGKMITIGCSMVFLGQLLACTIGLFTLDSLESGNWRALTLWTTVPAVISILLNPLFLDESIRYLLIKGQFEKAFGQLDRSAQESSKSKIKELTPAHKEALHKWVDIQREIDREEREVGIRSLFGSGYAKITLIIWFSWFVHSFCYFGLTLFIPYILTKMENPQSQSTDIKPSATSGDIGDLTLSVGLESLSVLMSFFIIDRKSFGRKGALVFFYVLAAIVAVVAFVDRTRLALIIWTTVLKIVLNVCSFYNYLMTTEIYPTRYRATGVGAATAVGKAGSIFMPWICSLLIQFDLFGPFIAFFVMNLLGAIFTLRLPFDTADKEMK